MDKKTFSKLKIHEKLEHLKKNGSYVGVRNTYSHRVYLYTLFGSYIEMWVIKGLNQIQWIEFQNNQSILEEYVKNLEWRNVLGIN
jgi:hypothetical protein